MAVAATATIAGLGASGSAGAQDPPPEIYDEWHAARVAELDALFASAPCPAIPGHTAAAPVTTTTTQTQGALGDDQFVQLLIVAADPTYRCDYTSETNQQSTFTVTFTRDGEFNDFGCTAERRDENTVQLGNLDPQRAISGTYRAAPDFPDPALLEAAARQVAAVFAPAARGCPAEPVAATCPPIADFETSEATITESSGAPDTYKVSCSYTPPGEPTADRVTLDIQVSWVPPLATSAARLESLCATETGFDRGWGTIGGDGLAIRAVYGTSSINPIDMTPVEEATRAIIAQVAGQAQSCEGVAFTTRSSQFTPIPGPYASAFTADLIAGRTPPMADAADAATPPPAPPPEEAPDPDEPAAPATTALAETAPADAAPAPAPATAPPAPQGDSLSSGLALALRIVTIVLLVLSLLGLLVSFLLIRRESRIRPKLDLARLLIILVTASVMMVIFSSGAPIWAVALALAIGLGLGFLQGSTLAIRITESGVMAKRSAWAIVAFAVSIVTAQVAGLLNRTGVIAFGIALSFLSAALTAGLIAGRRRPIADARRALAGTAVLVMLTLPVLPLLADSDAADAQDDDAPRLEIGAVRPDERTPAMDTLIDVVPWDAAEITGGLWWDRGKPWTPAPMPRALDTIPDPLTRTVEWTSAAGSSPELIDTYSVTETFEFAERIDGFCCSVTYTGEGTHVDARGTAQQVTVAGKLQDIQSVAIEGSASINPSNFGGQPFTEVVEWDAPLESGETTVCRRAIGVTRNTRLLERYAGEADLSTTLDGAPTDTFFVNPVVIVGVPCEIPELSLESVLAAAPPPPPADAEERRGCPVIQETLAALSAGTTFPGFDSRTLADAALEPNEPTCQYGALAALPAIGMGGRGNTRMEFAIDVAEPRRGEWDLGYSRWGARDNQIFAFGPSDVPAQERCSFDDAGALIEPAPGRSCRSISLHKVQLPGPTGIRQSQEVVEAWVQLIIEFALFDGPNTEFNAAFPWASYHVRCHHCLPSDAEIADFLRRLHDHYNDGHGSFGPGADEAPPDEAAGPVATDGEAPDGTDVPATDVPQADVPVTTVAGETEVTEDDVSAAGLAPGDSEETREAALAAVLAALAAAGVLVTSLAEVGLSMPQLIETYRTGGRPAVDALIAQRTASSVDHASHWTGSGTPPDEGDGPSRAPVSPDAPPTDDGTRITTDDGTVGPATAVTDDGSTRVGGDGTGTAVTDDASTRVGGDGTGVGAAGDGTSTDGESTGPRRSPENWENVPLADPDAVVPDLPAEGDGRVLTPAEIAARQSTGADGAGRVLDRWGNHIATIDSEGVARASDGSVVQVVWDDVNNRGVVGIVDDQGRWIEYGESGQAEQRVRTLAPDAARTPGTVSMWEGVTIANGEVRTADGTLIGTGTNPTNLVDLNGNPLDVRGSNVNPEVLRALPVPDRGDRFAEETRPVADAPPLTPAGTPLSPEVSQVWRAHGAGPNGELYGSDGRRIGTIDVNGTMTTMDGRVIIGGTMEGGQFTTLRTADGQVFDGTGRRTALTPGDVPDPHAPPTQVADEDLSRLVRGEGDAPRTPTDDGTRVTTDTGTPPADDGTRVTTGETVGPAPAEDGAARPPAVVAGDDGEVRPVTDGGDGPRGAGTLGGLLDIEGARILYEQHIANGMSPAEAAMLAAAQTQAGNAASATNAFGGMTDPRFSAAAGALLPGGMQNIMPDALATNTVGTGHQALSAFSQDLGTSFATGELNTEQLDAFAQSIAERDLDPFAGWAQTVQLLGEESARSDGGNLASDLQQIYATGAGMDQVNESMAGFSDAAGSGTYGPALEGVSHLTEIGSDMLVDPSTTTSEFAADVQRIWEHGVGDGYWEESLAHTDQVIRNTPVAGTIYDGYTQLFESSPSELAEGAAALGDEAMTAAAQAASDAADYVWSWF